MSYEMTIDGRPRTGQASIEVVNPATGEPFARCPDATRGELDEALAAARGSLAAWAADEDRRRDALRRCAELLRERADAVAPTLTQEQGKPLANAADEIRSAAVWFDYYAGLELEPEILQDDETSRVEVVRKPCGVVAAITPWNYPVLLAAWKLAPALRAGNTVVVKPSPYTPLSTLLVGSILAEALPPGVLGVVSGGDELGAWMTEHPEVDKISFTGSVATGRKVATSAGPGLKRLTLELGGNDAAIVLPDADPAAVGRKLFWGAFSNSGQICSAIKRLYVHESLFDDVVESVAATAAQVTVGDGMEEGTQLGPINNRPQYERVCELVAEARAAGAEAVVGGEPLDRPGYFFPLTVLTGASEGQRIVDEEQFGPALPVLPFSDVDEAVARANATSFGLSGSVWSADEEKAAAVASRLECGTAWVNTHIAIRPFAPFGGAKQSGIGVENGPWGLRAFTEIQVLHRARG